MNQVATAAEKQLPIKLGVTKAALGKLKKKYPGDNLPDPATKEGYNEFVLARRELTPLRVMIEKERKIQIASALSHQKRVNGEAKEITAAIESIEAPWYAAKKEFDDRKANEKAEKERVEIARIDAIESRVNDIHGLTGGLLGASLSGLQARLEDATATVVDDSFDEFEDAANIVLAQAIKQLQSAIEERTAMDSQQAEINKQREEMAEQQRKLDADKAEMDRVRVAKENEERAEKQKIENDRLKKVADERKAKELEENATALLERMPEDQKMRMYADLLTSIATPEIEDKYLCQILARAVTMVYDAHLFIIKNTQGS